MLTKPNPPIPLCTPRVDLLAALLNLYTEEQLEQFVRISTAARDHSGEVHDRNGLFADVKIRFKAGLPRWMGVELWEETEKEKEKP